MRMLTEDEREWLVYLDGVAKGMPRRVPTLSMAPVRLEKFGRCIRVEHPERFDSYITDAGRKALRVDDIIRQLGNVTT